MIEILAVLGLLVMAAKGSGGGGAQGAPVTASNYADKVNHEDEITYKTEETRTASKPTSMITDIAGSQITTVSKGGLDIPVDFAGWPTDPEQQKYFTTTSSEGVGLLSYYKDYGWGKFVDGRFIPR